MRLNIRHLSGEDADAAGARLLSRHSFSQGAKDAADWIEHQLKLTGARCRQERFLTGYAPNVIWSLSFIHVETSVLIIV